MSCWKIAYFKNYHLSEAIKEAEIFLERKGESIIDIRFSVATYASGDSCCILYKEVERKLKAVKR